MENLFTIPDSGKDDVAMDELHYYNWLKSENKRDIHGIATKLEYLETLGYIHVIDIVPIEDVNILSATEQHYFIREIRDTIVLGSV